MVKVVIVDVDDNDDDERKRGRKGSVDGVYGLAESG